MYVIHAQILLPKFWSCTSIDGIMNVAIATMFLYYPDFIEITSINNYCDYSLLIVNIGFYNTVL